VSSRRGFLTALAAGMVLDPERLLWRPNRVTYSIPAPAAMPLMTAESIQAALAVLEHFPGNMGKAIFVGPDHIYLLLGDAAEKLTT